MLNPWKVLGVHRASSEIEIRSAYINLARKAHPDAGGRIETFQKINEAYQILGNSKVAKQFIKEVEVYAKKCNSCDGCGYKAKQKSLSARTMTPCVTCKGAGHMILNGD